MIRNILLKTLYLYIHLFSLEDFLTKTVGKIVDTGKSACRTPMTEKYTSVYFS